MAIEIRLEQVRKRTGGRIHLTVRVPKEGPVQTLCGKSFKPGEYVRTDAQADCQICLRRRGNEAIISSAFFQQDLGEELLKLSLQRARERRDAEPGKPAKPEKAKPPPKLVVVPSSEPEAPKVLGELELAGLKRVSERVYLSPAGAIVRIRKQGDAWEVEEVAFNGPVQVRRRRADRLELKVGDLRAVFSIQAGRVEGAYRLEAED